MMHPAVEAVQARAVALLRPGNERAFATDVHTFSKTTQKPPAVLVAIATPTHSIVIAVDASEYDGVALAHLAGFPDAQAPTAYEIARQQGLTARK